MQGSPAAGVADEPIENPTKLEMAINMKAAKAGVHTVPLPCSSAQTR
jgi:hypothetical protein